MLRVILTLPAGTLEAGEEPFAGARGELLEKTGYASDDWQSLPVRTMHGNAGGNQMHAFVARNCRKRAEPNSGDLEDISLEFKTAREILEAIDAGEMPLASDSAALLSGCWRSRLLQRSSGRIAIAKRGGKRGQVATRDLPTQPRHQVLIELQIVPCQQH